MQYQEARMSQSAVIEREASRQAPRAPLQTQRPDEKAKVRVIEAEAPSVERARNVGGRLMV